MHLYIDRSAVSSRAMRGWVWRGTNHNSKDCDPTSNQRHRKQIGWGKEVQNTPRYDLNAAHQENRQLNDTVTRASTTKGVNRSPLSSFNRPSLRHVQSFPCKAPKAADHAAPLQGFPLSGTGCRSRRSSCRSVRERAYSGGSTRPSTFLQEESRRVSPDSTRLLGRAGESRHLGHRGQFRPG